MTRRVRLPRLSRRVLLVALPLVILLCGGYLWLRDSSLVAVRQVSIQLGPGPEAAGIRAALTRAARTMTTLDVQQGQLSMAVSPYPVVEGLQVSTEFPHGLRIRVIEKVPVAAITAGGRTVAVAGDGTLLHDMPTTSLPTIPLRVPPGGTKLSDPAALREVAVLAAAPYAMLSHIAQVTSTGADGVVAQLRGGPSLRFGDASQLSAKWSAATAVLADPGSAGASYIDLSDPSRPAAGSGSAAAAATAATSASSASTSGSASTSTSG